MFQKREYPFNYKYTVFELKQFHLRKKRKLEDEIREKSFSDDKIPVAQKYIRIIESVLKSDYFRGNMVDCMVGDLMKWLKEDDVIFVNKIEELKKKIQSMKANLKMFEQSGANSGYIIPDESIDYEASFEERKRKYLWEIEAVQGELNDYEYRLRLCRNLKGMIQRPEGFYNAVYRIKPN